MIITDHYYSYQASAANRDQPQAAIIEAIAAHLTHWTAAPEHVCVLACAAETIEIASGQTVRVLVDPHLPAGYVWIPVDTSGYQGV